MDLRSCSSSLTSSSSNAAMLTLPFCSCSYATFLSSRQPLSSSLSTLDALSLTGPSTAMAALSFRHRRQDKAVLQQSRIPKLNSTWKWPCSSLTENAVPAKHEYYTVGDFMTRLDELFVVKTSCTVDEALDLLVQNRVTGLPVVDEAGKLIGVVSDFDLLALDSISGTGKRSSDSSLFPEAGSTWKAFKELQKLLSKTKGRTVGEVMTPSPLVVREMTNLEDAARLLLETKYRRLPVVDDNGKLLGLLTRGNVIRAALKMKHDAEMSS